MSYLVHLVDLIFCQRASLSYMMLLTPSVLFSNVLSQAKHQCQVINAAKSIVSCSSQRSMKQLTLSPLLHCFGLLNAVKRKVLFLVSPFSQFNNTGLLFIRQNSLMLIVCVIWLHSIQLTFSLCLWQSLFCFSYFQLPLQCFSHHSP